MSEQSEQSTPSRNPQTGGEDQETLLREYEAALSVKYRSTTSHQQNLSISKLPRTLQVPPQSSGARHPEEALLRPAQRPVLSPARDHDKIL